MQTQFGRQAGLAVSRAGRDIAYRRERVGRHYAGPTWEMTDGSAVTQSVAHTPGADANDIPLLKLEATSWRGMGQLSTITTIQRLNTRGGRVDAPCDTAGTFLSVPYTADYAFYRKTTDPLPRQTH